LLNKKEKQKEQRAAAYKGKIHQEAKFYIVSGEK
jgi:hypothetical protein